MEVIQEYLQYPSTIRSLANEIIKLCNDYNARRIPNHLFRAGIIWYAETCPEKMFAAENLNPTLSQIIGKKRVHLINQLLSHEKEQYDV